MALATDGDFDTTFGTGVGFSDWPYDQDSECALARYFIPSEAPPTVVSRKARGSAGPGAASMGDEG